jgi:HSP20 family protein
MRREMQTLFDALEGTTASRSPGVFPAVNVTQDPDNFYLRAELPGVKTGDLDLSAVQNRVTLSGKREIPQEEGASYHRRERAGGSFGRTVTLPQEIDTKKVAARYDNGILTVTLPKVEAHKPRSIAIKTR